MGEGFDWPPGLPRLASTQPLKGGFICRTTMGLLADGLAALGAASAPVPAVLGSLATCWCWNASVTRRAGRPSVGPSPGCIGGPGTALAGIGTASRG